MPFCRTDRGHRLDDVVLGREWFAKALGQSADALEARDRSVGAFDSRTVSVEFGARHVVLGWWSALPSNELSQLVSRSRLLAFIFIDGDESSDH